MRCLLVLLLLAALVATSASASVSANRGGDGGRRGPAATLLLRLADATNAKNLTAIAALLADDGQFLVPPDTGVVPMGKIEFLFLLEGFFGFMGLNFFDMNDLYDVAPHAAAARFTQSAFAAKPENGYFFHQGYFVARTTADGSQLSYLNILKANSPAQTNQSAMVDFAANWSAASTQADFVPKFYSRSVVTRDWGYSNATWGNATTHTCDYTCTAAKIAGYDADLRVHRIYASQVVAASSFVAFTGHFFVQSKAGTPPVELVTKGVHVLRLVGDDDYSIAEWDMYGLDGPPYNTPQ